MATELPHEPEGQHRPTVTPAQADLFVRTAAASTTPSDTRDAFRLIRDELDALRAAQHRDRDAVVRAIKYWTEDPDRCDMQDREPEVADTVLAALRGEDLDQ